MVLVIVRDALRAVLRELHGKQHKDWHMKLENHAISAQFAPLNYDGDIRRVWLLVFDIQSTDNDF
jgi:hypothetical protein